jgi:hypothetical protein
MALYRAHEQGSKLFELSFSSSASQCPPSTPALYSRRIKAHHVCMAGRPSRVGPSAENVEAFLDNQQQSSISRKKMQTARISVLLQPIMRYHLQLGNTVGCLSHFYINVTLQKTVVIDVNATLPTNSTQHSFKRGLQILHYAHPPCFTSISVPWEILAA